jgi:Inner membrane component of T3SS, cytoplasmic domain/Inner membrane component of T3SS, periplasmic domain
MQHLVAESTAWRFEIADGPNAGASVVLLPGRYRLGSDAANDIVLADPDVSPSHAVLDLARDRADIIALAPGVLLQRRGLETDRPNALKCGAIITLGATRLRVAGPPVPSRRHHKALVPISLILLGMAGAGIAYGGATPVPIRAMQIAGAVDEATDGATLARAVAEFRAHLADIHSPFDLEVSASDGVVLATGTILPQDRTAWLAAEKWFDDHVKGQYALANRVRVAASAGPPQLDVAAVSMAPVPNVITRDGQHYTVGAVLADGWSIDSITPDNIILRSGGRTVRITL